jgi:hypothetical protein
MAMCWTKNSSHSNSWERAVGWIPEPVRTSGGRHSLSVEGLELYWYVVFRNTCRKWRKWYRSHKYYVAVEVLTMVTMNITVLYVLSPCSSERARRFGRTYRLNYRMKELYKK